MDWHGNCVEVSAISMGVESETQSLKIALALINAARVSLVLKAYTSSGDLTACLYKL